MPDTLREISEAIKVVEAIRKQIDHEEDLRINLLSVHALLNCLLGTFLMQAPARSFTNPAWTWLQIVPGGSTPLGAVFLLAGLLLAYGIWTTDDPTRWRWVRAPYFKIYGMSIAIVMDLSFGAGFMYSHFTQPTLPPIYPVVIYTSIAVLGVLHIRTIRFRLREMAQLERIRFDAIPVMLSIAYDERTQRLARTLTLIERSGPHSVGSVGWPSDRQN